MTNIHHGRDLFWQQCHPTQFTEFSQKLTWHSIPNPSQSNFKYPTDFKFQKVSDSIGFGIRHIPNNSCIDQKDAHSSPCTETAVIIVVFFNAMIKLCTKFS